MNTTLLKMERTGYSEYLIARSMYQKGKSFIGASLLLRKNGGYEFVVLHLLCQGIELILKSILLFSDYKKHGKSLKRVGHDLEKLISLLILEKIFSGLSPEINVQINELNVLYKRHLLRYGSDFDISTDPVNINSDKVEQKILQVIKLTDIHIYQNS